jgi:hypothetical protein
MAIPSRGDRLASYQYNETIASFDPTLSFNDRSRRTGLTQASSEQMGI